RATRRGFRPECCTGIAAGQRARADCAAVVARSLRAVAECIGVCALCERNFVGIDDAVAVVVNPATYGDAVRTAGDALETDCSGPFAGGFVVGAKRTAAIANGFVVATNRAAPTATGSVTHPECRAFRARGVVVIANRAAESAGGGVPTA